jgi:hypothetical protein
MALRPACTDVPFKSFTTTMESEVLVVGYNVWQEEIGAVDLCPQCIGHVYFCLCQNRGEAAK